MLTIKDGALVAVPLTNHEESVIRRLDRKAALIRNPRQQLVFANSCLRKMAEAAAKILK